MPTSDWERGYDAGYRAALGTARRDIGRDFDTPAPASKAKKTRKPSAYNREYSKQFKRLESKYKTKSGGWRKGGYKALVKAAHAATRKVRK